GVLLIALGLVMVLSSTMVNSITETGSAFSMFQRQLTSAAIGLPLMLLAAHLPVSGFRVIGYPAMIISVALLLLTVFQGTEVNGALRWLEIGGLLIQPSEPAKIAFALCGAGVLARKDELRELTEWRHLLIPLLPGCGMLTMRVAMSVDLVFVRMSAGDYVRPVRLGPVHLLRSASGVPRLVVRVRSTHQAVSGDVRPRAGTGRRRDRSRARQDAQFLCFAGAH